MQLINFFYKTIPLRIFHYCESFHDIDMARKQSIQVKRQYLLQNFIL